MNTDIRAFAKASAPRIAGVYYQPAKQERTYYATSEGIKSLPIRPVIKFRTRCEDAPCCGCCD